MNEPLREPEPPSEGLEAEPRSLRMLVVLDEPEAVRAVRLALAEHGSGADVEWVHGLDEALSPLQRCPFDLVLLDLALVDNQSLEVLDELALRQEDSLLVLLERPHTAPAHPRQLLSRVAHETLPRDERLSDSLAHLLRFARRSLALQARASRYESLFHHSGDGMLLFDAHGAALDANPHALEQLCYTREELLDLRLEALYPESEAERVQAALLELGSARAVRVELPVQRRDGTAFPAEVAVSSFHSGGQELVQVVVRDVSGRRALEQRLQEAQKMEALGRLASGVAHDLNNLLTVIHGYGALLHDALPPAGEAHAFLAEVTAAGKRAAALTHQLLAFSRRQVLQPRLLDVNAELSQLELLLRRTLGEDVHLAVELAPDLPRVRIDPAQLEQVVINLAVNARDAMPHGGELTLATGIASPPAGEAAKSGENPRWVRLRVRDTGVGMSDEVLAHLFEPFFTTKARGKGTGLGLASVYGAVQQSGGDIEVTSTLGVGTTFEILLPPARREELPPDSGAHPTLTPRPSPPGGESVLVVEDDAALRRLVCTVLRGAGYRVMDAEDGDAALAIAGCLTPPLDLVICDVVLPDRSGVEIARRILSLQPGARILFMSGHAQDALARHGRLLSGSRFIAKPFGPEALLARVSRTLTRPAR